MYVYTMNIKVILDGVSSQAFPIVAGPVSLQKTLRPNSKEIV